MSTSVASQFTVAAATGGVTAAKGFTAAGLHCGIKAKAGVLDLSVLAADTAVPAAGLFTTNLAQAAPVTVSKQHLEASQGLVRAIVVNSGCANACTGSVGMSDARRMAAETAAQLGCQPEQVLVASTGVIGVNLKMDKLVPGIRAAALERHGQRTDGQVPGPLVLLDQVLVNAGAAVPLPALIERGPYQGAQPAISLRERGLRAPS